MSVLLRDDKVFLLLFHRITARYRMVVLYDNTTTGTLGHSYMLKLCATSTRKCWITYCLQRTVRRTWRGRGCEISVPPFWRVRLYILYYIRYTLRAARAKLLLTYIFINPICEDSFNAHANIICITTWSTRKFSYLLTYSLFQIRGIRWLHMLKNNINYTLLCTIIDFQYRWIHFRTLYVKIDV